MKLKKILKNAVRMSILTIAALFAGCDDWVYDDLSECKMNLKFRYDYNLLNTDAFPQQVEKVTVFFFDENGYFIKSQSDSGDALKNSDYSMPVELPAGHKYTALAWTGLLDSYDVSQLIPGVSTKQDLLLSLNKYNSSTLVCNEQINDLWHGTPIEFERIEGSQTETINLVRDNNYIRFVLIDMNSQADTIQTASNFDIKVTANNAKYDYANNLLTSPIIEYIPYYTSGNSHEGILAELNTLRLMSDSNYRLSIIDKTTGKSIFGDYADMDLVSLLLKTKLENYKTMPDQEYLDREYEWKIIIYYTSGGTGTNEDNATCAALKIIVNSWTVWQQNVDLGD